MKAVILAGGRGIRLGELTHEMPKPMISIGNKPLLHHLVLLLVKYNIRDIIVLVNYLKDPIIEYFGNGKAFGANISYFEEIEPLGTVGGIKAIENQLTDDFLVIYGDVMVNMDLSRLIYFHRTNESQCTLVLHPNDHPYDSDLVETNASGRVVDFHPKPHDTEKYYRNLVNAGLYILSPEILKFLEKDKKADFGRDIFPKIYDQVKMYGYITSEYLKDMGTPYRLEKVRNDQASGRIEHRCYELPQKAIFLDRDGVLNVERSYINDPEDLELYDFTPDAIKKINESDYLSVVVTNQAVVARNMATIEDVETIHHKMESDLGNNHAWLDAIYFCPHHPDKGFQDENKDFKIECDCRKPKIGMFTKAADAFHINLHQSFMIGDSERDIQAGINAGCVTIGVRTGYGIRKTITFPDYFFRDLSEAVDFIIDDPYAPVFTDIFKRYENHKGKQPFIILIGGNTRSGKSTLASYLRLAFGENGKKAMVVELDNWLLPEKERSPNMNVYDRFRLPVIEVDLQLLINGGKLFLNKYVNHPERKPLLVEYDTTNADVLIIEGVVALSSQKVREFAHLKLFTSLPEDLLISRIEEYYTWRDKPAEEINSIFKKRKTDEYQLIEKESKLADLIIKPFGS